MESAVETSFISKDEIALMEQHLLANYQISDDKIVINRESFIKKITNNF